MRKQIDALIGQLPVPLIHYITNDELLMLKELFDDIVSIKEDSDVPFHQSLSTFFFGIAITTAITYETLEAPPIFLLFVIANTAFLGIYQLRQRYIKKAKAKTEIAKKKQKFDKLIDLVQSRLDESKPSTNTNPSPEGEDDSKLKAV